MIACRRSHLAARCRQRGYTLDEVRPCIVSQDGDQITVDETHPAYPAKPKPGVVPPNPAARPPTSGPGTELKALLATIGIVASPTCKCNKMARQMDQWGPDESLAHMEEIVDVMEETAKARKLPFLRAVAKQLIRLAVRRARKKDIN
jgi:hypothetical protein